MIIRHLLAELYGCGAAINDLQALQDALGEGIGRSGAEIIHQAQAIYQEHGFTVIYFLAESHAMLTTWPEHDLVLLDVLMCNEAMDPDAVLDPVEKCLAPSGGVKKRYVPRSVTPGID